MALDTMKGFKLIIVQAKESSFLFKANSTVRERTENSCRKLAMSKGVSKECLLIKFCN